MRFSRAMLPACLVALGAVLAAAAGLASPGTALAAKAAKPPATDAAKKVMATISLIEDKLSSTRYQHFTVVNPKKGIFHWDCSGMVEWILGKAAPKARSVLSKKHPTAKEFYTVISNRSTQKPHKGWLRLHGPNSIGPGDVFAWIKPSFWKHRKNTGHVGIVLTAMSGSWTWPTPRATCTRTTAGRPTAMAATGPEPWPFFSARTARPWPTAGTARSSRWTPTCPRASCSAAWSSSRPGRYIFFRSWPAAVSMGSQTGLKGGA
jgi:hypothetical protein